MRFQKIIPKSRDRRGQMFIMSTLMICLYLILITGSLIELRTDLERSDLIYTSEVYRNLKNDVSQRAVVDLARATATGVGQAQLRDQFEEVTIPLIVNYGIGKGIDVSIDLIQYVVTLNPSLGGYDSGSVKIEVFVSIVGEDSEIQDKFIAYYGISSNRVGAVVTLLEYVNSETLSRPVTDARVTSGTLNANNGDGTYDIIPGPPIEFILSNFVVITVS